MRILTIVAVILTGAPQAHAQLQSFVSVTRTNREIAGQVIDFTHNHGKDRRIYSPLLGMSRDLYVYLPPGYNPCLAYPLILYFHGGFGDEHAFLDGDRIQFLDSLIQAGQFPPVIVACPDGAYSGRNLVMAAHSCYLDGCGGPVQEHVLRELLPFLMRCYSIRPEREAHAVLGLSAGGLGALNLAIRYRDIFATVATLSAPANLRCANCQANFDQDFNAGTYRWTTEYDPNQIVGRFDGGLVRMKAKRFIAPVFGKGPGVMNRIAAENPADLLFTTNLQPGELAIYLNYAGRDNFNFDAQAESFAWLAAQRGIPVTLERDPDAQHSLTYFRTNQKRAYLWLACHLLPPTPITYPRHQASD